ncbi:protein phosphatase 1 regulatory subunit 12A-like [Panonychus citri]|uniref:protein phosphatase 1 regulatory subunit 12A-like n=1 Tax=Panonychus citri TaxID=50023 RepID=UPI0023075F1C|nr:protein phosphatase 1 regulatory subunit 12A-like [Panonychus citri]XP_053209529.1 protein phosphatase 1 regulatory subunit 12A-like [Panonychus citri]
MGDNRGVNGKPKIKFSHPTTFLAACACNDLNECERLLSQNMVNINCTNVDGLTALHQACIDDNIKMVRFLLDHGADIDCCDHEGWTPLHATASCGNESIASLLLEKGADPRIINNDGELACDITDSLVIKETIEKKLLELGVTDADSLRHQEHICMLSDVNNWLKTQVVDDKPHPKSGATILHVAAAKGYIDVLGTLLNNRTLRSQLDIDARDHEGWTPLAAACYWQKPGAVQLLILHGADVNAKTSSGQRLQDLTIHELILQLLEEKRHKLAEEQKLREQMKSQMVSQSKVVPPSPPSAPTPPTESETQRKAHAKRVRETRRSTQGVSAEDVKQAKEQFMITSLVPASPAVINSSISTPKTTTPPSPTSPTTPTLLSPTITSSTDNINTLSSTTISSIAPSPLNSSSYNNPANSNASNNNNNNNNNNHNTRNVNNNNNNNPLIKQQSDQIKFRPTRCRLPPAPLPPTSTTPTSPSQSSKCDFLQSPLDQLDSSSSSSSNVSSSSDSKNFRQLYESLTIEMEKLKKEIRLKEHEWNKEKRSLQRKLSELEEEIKQLETFKSDNKRLKDENGALIRVISKLSK